jgi:hypothetical protein
MSVLFYGIALFVITLLIHIIVWRIRLPIHQKTIMLLLFGLILIAGIFMLIILGKSIKIFGITAPAAIYEYIQLGILFISLTLAYIVTYSALEADSPSLVMVMTIAYAGKEGLKKELFKQKINDGVLLVPRIHDLISEKLAYLDKGKYKLTPKGLMFARIFSIYRGILRRPQKGG